MVLYVVVKFPCYPFEFLQKRSLTSLNVHLVSPEHLSGSVFLPALTLPLFLAYIDTWGGWEMVHLVTCLSHSVKI